MVKKKETFLYTTEYSDTMFRSEANKSNWFLYLSGIYIAVIVLVYYMHSNAENVNTDVTKFTMPILYTVITLTWIILCVLLIRKRTINIDENGFSFQCLRKTKIYPWTDILEVDVDKSKNGNYIVVTFKDGKKYGTNYDKDIDNVIKKYYKS